jgi:hypothetical protein
MLLTSVLVLLALLLGAGCASIPRSGPVRGGQEPATGEEDQQPVLVVPQRPRIGAPPEEIVAQFLAASESFDDAHAGARLFLTPEVAEQWRPEERVVVYDSSSSSRAVTGDQVTLLTEQVAAIDAEGRYAELPTRKRVTASFEMQQVGGEWRISALEDGIYLTDAVIRRAYTHLNVYFLTSDRKYVVPDPILLPQRRPELATVLTKRLLQGPTALGSAVSTAFPPGTDLAISSVSVRNGVALVDLNEVALQAGDADRQAMSAQLVWTLSPLPDVQAVRITVEGKSLRIPGANGEDQPDGAWASYDPDVMLSSEPFLVSGGILGRLGRDNKFAAMEGVLGRKGPALRAPAVSADGSKVALLSRDGTTLYVGEEGQTTPLRSAVRAGRLSRPSWDRAGGVWVADVATGRVLTVDGEAAREVSMPDLAGAQLRGIRLARDGVRVVVLTRRGNRDEVLVGSVLRSDKQPPAVTDLRRIAPTLVEVREVAWAAADSIAVLGREADGVVQPVLADVDGYEHLDTAALPDAATLAAAPGQPLLVGTTAGVVMQLSGRQWRQVVKGSDPAYPG